MTVKEIGFWALVGLVVGIIKEWRRNRAVPS